MIQIQNHRSKIQITRSGVEVCPEKRKAKKFKTERIGHFSQSCKVYSCGNRTLNPIVLSHLNPISIQEVRAQEQAYHLFFLFPLKGLRLFPTNSNQSLVLLRILNSEVTLGFLPLKSIHTHNTLFHLFLK